MRLNTSEYGMSQERLNTIMVLHVHKQKNDDLDILDNANQFVNKEHGQSIFGKFISTVKLIYMLIHYFCK